MQHMRKSAYFGKDSLKLLSQLPRDTRSECQDHQDIIYTLVPFQLYILSQLGIGSRKNVSKRNHIFLQENSEQSESIKAQEML